MIVGFRSIGGLGNQMFVYACAVSFSKHRRCPYCLSRLRELKYFRLQPGDNLCNSVKWYGLMLISKLARIREYVLKDGWIDYTGELGRIKLPCLVKGYFQGESYFAGYEELIWKRFRIRKKYVKEYNRIADRYRDRKIAAVHFRRTDYQSFDDKSLEGPDLTLPLHYYTDLIRELQAKDDYLFVFLGDDMDYVRANFKNSGDFYFSDNPEIIDLQIIMNADICIIANSSFAWWGAYLNGRKEKIVYVPEHFLGFKTGKEYPANIIPQHWIKVKVK